MDGIIFGWSVVGPPIVHHVGIILQWDGPKSVVAHYGVEARPIVLVETLRRAALRTSRGKGITVHFNPHCLASIQWDPIYLVDVQDPDWEGLETQFNLTPELQEYEMNHPRYDLQHSNCQHFVSNFVGNIGLESDLYPHIPHLSARLAHLCLLRSEVKIKEFLLQVVDTYTSYRDSGICRWDPSMDLWIPPEDQSHD